MSPRPVWSLSEFRSKIQSQTNKSKKKKERRKEREEREGGRKKETETQRKSWGRERGSWEEEWEGKEKRKTRKFISQPSGPDTEHVVASRGCYRRPMPFQEEHVPLYSPDVPLHHLRTEQPQGQ